MDICFGFVAWGALLAITVGGTVEEFSMHGTLGFLTESPSIDRHLWAVRCGYVPGPEVAGSGSGVMELLTWLGGMDIVVTEPLPFVCVVTSVVTVSADGSLLKTLVGDVLSGVVSRCGLEQRLPRIRGCCMV